jgi:hypothetical protein
MAASDNRSQADMPRDQIERIGIDHQRFVDNQCAFEKIQRNGIRAKPGTDQQAIAFGDHRIRIAQHQFERGNVDGGPFERHETDAHLAGANFHRRTAGEQRPPQPSHARRQRCQACRTFPCARSGVRVPARAERTAASASHSSRHPDEPDASSIAMPSG